MCVHVCIYKGMHRRRGMTTTATSCFGGEQAARCPLVGHFEYIDHLACRKHAGQNYFFHGGSGTPIQYMIPWSPNQNTPNVISIGSAVFAPSTVPANRQTTPLRLWLLCYRERKCADTDGTVPVPLTRALPLDSAGGCAPRPPL